LSGGVCGYYAARHPGRLTSLVLLNPLLNYKKRFIDDQPHWHDGKIDDERGRELAAKGFIEHSPTFKLGRPLLNEVFYSELNRALMQVITPTLLIHGSKDTFVPVESSRAASTYLAGETKFIELDGAEHGFAVPNDPRYRDPQTRKWQAFVIESIAQWVTGH
jgi:pimeloyl-ACP methyl ester carboxylesterase